MDKKCKLCLSPYRNEVLSLYKNRVKVPVIYRKLAAPMNYHSTMPAFRQMIVRHVKEKHKVQAVVLPNNKNGLTRASIEEFAQRFLDLGMVKLSQIDPNNPEDLKNVRFREVVAAQKLFLDSKKLKLTEDAMGIMLGKMFAPPSLRGKVVEGELVDGSSS